MRFFKVRIICLLFAMPLFVSCSAETRYPIQNGPVSAILLPAGFEKIEFDEHDTEYTLIFQDSEGRSIALLAMWLDSESSSVLLDLQENVFNPNEGSEEYITIYSSGQNDMNWRVSGNGTMGLNQMLLYDDDLSFIFIAINNKEKSVIDWKRLLESIEMRKKIERGRKETMKAGSPGGR